MRRIFSLQSVLVLGILAAFLWLPPAHPVYARFVRSGNRFSLPLIAQSGDDISASDGFSAPPQQAATSVSPLNPQATATPEQIETVITSTPNPDGSVVHEVQPGQALWSIAVAYGITINDLNTMNRLGNNPIVRVGDKLIIAGPSTPTISPTVTETVRPPTRTPTLSPTPRPTRPTFTPSVTPTPTPKPLLPNISSLSPESRRTIGLSLVIVCALGLLLIAAGSFLKRSK